MTLKTLFSLRDKRKKTAIDYIIGADTLVDLYMNYKNIRKHGEPEKRLNHYLSIIETDIPRTYRNRTYALETKELLHTFCLYSPVGYIQGHNFLAAACVHFFRGRTPYLSFYLFNALFDNIKDIYLLQIDNTFANLETYTFAPCVESCLVLFLDFYKTKHPINPTTEMVQLALKNFVQWRLFGTLTLSCHMHVDTSKHVIRYFLPCLYDRDEFQKKLSALALSFLFCCFLDKALTEESILAVQGGALTEDGLLAMLDSAEHTIKLFK